MSVTRQKFRGVTLRQRDTRDRIDAALESGELAPSTFRAAGGSPREFWPVTPTRPITGMTQESFEEAQRLDRTNRYVGSTLAEIRSSPRSVGAFGMGQPLAAAPDGVVRGFTTDELAEFLGVRLGTDPAPEPDPTRSTFEGPEPTIRRANQQRTGLGREDLAGNAQRWALDNVPGLERDDLEALAGVSGFDSAARALESRGVDVPAASLARVAGGTLRDVVLGRQPPQTPGQRRFRDTVRELGGLTSAERDMIERGVSVEELIGWTPAGQPDEEEEAVGIAPTDTEPVDLQSGPPIGADTPKLPPNTGDPPAPDIDVMGREGAGNPIFNLLNGLFDTIDAIFSPEGGS